MHAGQTLHSGHYNAVITRPGNEDLKTRVYQVDDEYIFEITTEGNAIFGWTRLLYAFLSKVFR